MRTVKLLLMSLLGIASVFAQGNTGSITGTVSDPGGAVIAGAAFNWSWLIAVGIAPLLLTLLPGDESA